MLEGESVESMLRNKASLLGGGDGEVSVSDDEVWSILASCSDRGAVGSWNDGGGDVTDTGDDEVTIGSQTGGVGTMSVSSLTF